MPHSEERLMLKELKARIHETGHELIDGFCRYYSVDDAGVVKNSYEEYSYSSEDDLFSYSYRVILDRLYQFRMIHTYKCKPELKIAVLITDLQPATAPPTKP